MNIGVNIINFTSQQKEYNLGKHKVTEIYSDDGILQKRLEYDEFNRDVDSKNYDEKGVLIDYQHKDYYEKQNEKGCIETYKSKTQEYTRKSYTKYENGLKHTVDDFKSKTTSYINEFISDLSGKLVKIINNGNVIDLRK